jgi:DNA primase/ferredoxin
MHAEKASFRHAVELLRDGSVGTSASGGTKARFKRRLESPLEMTADDQELLAQIAEYYHNRLKESPDALAYLQQRGITDSEAITQFKIGFCDRTLGLRLPVASTKAGEAIRSRLKALGVLKDSGHEALRGCVTFPIALDGSGVGEIYGRRIDDHPKHKTPLHWYLSGPHRGVWNLAALRACDEIILCESILDALTFWSAGYRNVTTCYGTNGFTDDLRSAFATNSVKRILIAYDNDEGGNRAAGELAKQLLAGGFEVFRITFPKGMDANEYALKVTPAAQSLGLAIRKAEWIGGKSPGSRVESLEQTKTTNEEVAKKETPAASAEPLTQAAATLLLAAEPEAKQPPRTSPTPHLPQELEAEIRGNEIFLPIGDRTYRIRGLEKNLAFDVLKLNVMVRCGELFTIDTFDLYAARARGPFVKEAARELGIDPDVIKRDLGRVLLKLESLQEAQIQQTLAAKKENIEIPDKEKHVAIELLGQPDLIERILQDFESCGVVGEENNKLVGYLAATSRKLDKPLAVLIQSSSAAGKSSLMDAVLAFMPPEDVIKYSAMTGQSLFYMGETNLKHKILAIAEEEGVEQAAYALKLLQSEGELTIASTGKDPGTGRMETQEYHVEGPVMIFLTTTSDETDPELKNRCVTLGVCEHACHTEAIHRQQRTRRTLEGRQLQHERRAIRELHQNAQRLLRPLEVVNNFALQLTFRSDKTKSRRAHDHYLTLIESVTLLHQYQRREGTMTNAAGKSVRFVETTRQDIELANRLADHFLERSFAELPERTQVLLEQLIGGLRNRCESQKIDLWDQHFTRKDVRRWSTFGDTQLKEHLARLVDYEYLKIEAGGGKGCPLKYSLAYDPDSDQTVSPPSGLIDPDRLQAPDNLPAKRGKSPVQSEEVGEKNEEVAPQEWPQPEPGQDVPPDSREKGENGQADAA